MKETERKKKGEKRSRRTVVIVSRKQVPNNRVTVGDFLGREDPRGKEHRVAGRRRRRWRRWRRRGREPKGLVAEVTVPTASSRKANRGEPANAPRRAARLYTECPTSQALSLDHRYLEKLGIDSSFRRKFTRATRLFATSSYRVSISDRAINCFQSHDRPTTYDTLSYPRRDRRDKHSEIFGTL